MNQQGSVSIPDAAATLAVAFPLAFEETPGVLICSIENSSADVTKLVISAVVTAKSTTGFTVQLSEAVNSANYELHWYSGGVVPDTTLPVQARKITSFSRSLNIEDPDLITVVRQYPVPHTRTVTWGSVRSQVLAALEPTDVLFQAPAPATDDPGTPGSFLYPGGNYLYFKTATEWKRFHLMTYGVIADDAPAADDPGVPGTFLHVGIYLYFKTQTEWMRILLFEVP